MLQSAVGVPLEEIGPWLAGSKDELKAFEQKGIPYPYFEDAEDNELKRWILYGRKANLGTRFAIKGDGNTPYPAIQEVISTFQDWNINKFNLITNLEAPPGAD